MSNVLETYDPVSNGAESSIAMELPFRVTFTLEGTSAMLFHGWNNESVEAKSKAKKGSAAKKSDDVQSYVYRNEDGMICVPGAYVRGNMINAAKYRQDPRSPRKSAMDLFKAGIASLTEYASLGTKEWDYLDRRRVTVQRNSITRSRPAFKAGWRAEFTFLVLLPEYIDAHLFHDVLVQAGRLIGLGDYRPTYGRYGVVSFQVEPE